MTKVSVPPSRHMFLSKWLQFSGSCPKTPQYAPRHAQDAPKTPKRRPQEPPRAPKSHPRRPGTPQWSQVRANIDLRVIMLKKVTTPKRLKKWCKFKDDHVPGHHNWVHFLSFFVCDAGSCLKTHQDAPKTLLGRSKDPSRRPRTPIGFVLGF